ncbi:hypothetical protein PM082_021271 [Marasmius tenuissimus]|nr:hypothetical protein PM082_021271 [Marasmius tenuissimus]
MWKENSLAAEWKPVDTLVLVIICGATVQTFIYNDFLPLVIGVKLREDDGRIRQSAGFEQIRPGIPPVDAIKHRP